MTRSEILAKVGSRLNKIVEGYLGFKRKKNKKRIMKERTDLVCLHVRRKDMLLRQQLFGGYHLHKVGQMK